MSVTTIRPEDIVMIGDIAEREGVSRSAVQGWMRRHDFPAPITMLRAGAVYDYGDVYLWRERMPEASRR